MNTSGDESWWASVRPRLGLRQPSGALTLAATDPKAPEGWRSPKPREHSHGSWVASTSYLARIGTMNRGGFVAQAFEPAGPGDFPVARSWSTGLESPVNPQAGKPALQAGSWVAARCVAFVAEPDKT